MRQPTFRGAAIDVVDTRNVDDGARWLAIVLNVESARSGASFDVSIDVACALAAKRESDEEQAAPQHVDGAEAQHHRG